MLKIVLLISILFSFDSFSSCGVLPSGFNNCDFEKGNDLKATRLNEEMNKLENIANERTDSILNLNKNFVSGDIILKEDLENNIESILSIGQSPVDIVLDNNILSSDLSNQIDNAFSYIKSVDHNMALSSLFTGYSQEGLNSWSNYQPSILNDGFIGHTGLQNYTGNDSYNENMYRGLVYNFSQNVIVKSIVLYYIGSSGTGSWTIECWNGTWNILKTLPVGGNNGVPINFNEDGLISCSKYRIYVSSWTPAGTNMYLYEAEAYKYLK